MSISGNGQEPAAPQVSLLEAEAYDRMLPEERPGPFALVLYVAGTAPRSLRAIANTRRLCEQYLAGRCDLQVVDIYQQPALAELDGILAVPVLIKKDPPPLMRFIGDMSDLQRVIEGLGLAHGCDDGDEE